MNHNRVYFPPRPPKSPSKINNQYDPNPPLPNGRVSRQKSLEKSEGRSKASKYQNLQTVQQKRKALGNVRYINQLAQLDYEIKHQQIHTKFTKASKVSALKKIKAKNQMADFIDQEQFENEGFQQLMDYKYGNPGQNFYFQKGSQEIKQYKFCARCDQVHNDHPQVHQKICSQKLQLIQYNLLGKDYVIFCLERLINVLHKMKSQQFLQLEQVLQKLYNLSQTNQPKHIKQVNYNSCFIQLRQIYQMNKNQPILKGIIHKVEDLYPKK